MVSVIIPTFGGGDGLEKVINSILVQTYKEIEVIIVDDNGLGSDNQVKTAAVMQKFNEFANIKYITPQKNEGGSAARNRGARASRGEYLMFLDDDDTVSADKIEKQVKALSNTQNKVGIAYCSTRVFSNGELSNTILAKKSGNILYEYLMGRIYMGTGTALLIREAWETLGGYDESFIRHQDWEFFSRVLNKYDAIAVPDAYFNRYITNRNLPKKLDTLEKYSDHYIEFLKKYDFSLSKQRIRNVINRNNSRIALLCLKQKDFKRFIMTLSKHDHFFIAFISFVLFVGSVCKDKIIGKKS